MNPIDLNAHRYIERFKEIERLSPGKAFSILKRNWISLYIKNNNEKEADRQIILEKPLDEIITAFSSMKPSIFFEMFCEFHAIMIFIWTEIKKMHSDMQDEFFNQFYENWQYDLLKTDIFKAGLSHQEAKDVTFNFLLALSYASISDVSLVFHYHSVGLKILHDKGISMLSSKAVDNTITKCGDIYEIAFSGKTVKLKNSLGLEYIHYLIKNPYIEIHVNDLEFVVKKPILVECEISIDDLENESMHIENGSFASDVVADEEAIKAVKAALEKTEEDLEIANRIEDYDRIDKLEVLKSKYESYLNAAVGKEYKPRKNIDSNERARKRVWAAITDALNSIKPLSTDLYEHFSGSIKKKIFCIYSPKEKIDWR